MQKQNFILIFVKTENPFVKFQEIKLPENTLFENKNNLVQNIAKKSSLS